MYRLETALWLRREKRCSVISADSLAARDINGDGQLARVSLKWIHFKDKDTRQNKEIALAFEFIKTRNAISGSELNSLKTWIDANENGIAENGEIKTLAAAGIANIRDTDCEFRTRGNIWVVSASSFEPTCRVTALSLPLAVNDNYVLCQNIAA